MFPKFSIQDPFVLVVASYHGLNHLAHSCRFNDSVCHGCNKKGHLDRCCRNAQRRPNKSSTNINEVVEDPISQLYMLPSSKTKPLKTLVNIDGKVVEMEIDKGALVPVMTQNRRGYVFQRVVIMSFIILYILNG